MPIKQIFIPADLADRILIVDAASGVEVAPTELGDWIAVAGVKADGVARTFAEADPDDPLQPVFTVREDGGIRSDKDVSGTTPLVQAGDVVTAVPPGCSLEGAVVSAIDWRIYDPVDESVTLASGSGASWTVPNTTGTTGRRFLETNFTFSDPYSSRTAGSSATREIYGNSGAPAFTTEVTISGTGVVGTNGTIVPGTVTGSPTPAVAYQVYAGSAAQGAPQTSLTFPFSTAGVNYSVVATATNTGGEVTSTSNAIASTQPTVSAPTWNTAWWEWTELQVAPEGRLQVTIKGSPTFDANYDYYVFTSGLSTATVADVRKNGALFTATGVITRGAKSKGTSVIPRIVAIRKGIADDATDGIYVIATTSPAYVITGILSTGGNSAVDASMPKPTASILADALAEYGTTRDRAQFGSAAHGSSNVGAKHALPIIGLGAYYGDATAIAFCIDQCKYYYEGQTTYNYGTYTSKGSANFNNRDPFYEWSYSAQYDMMILAFFLACRMTPAVWDQLPGGVQKAILAGFEFVYVSGFYITGPRTATDRADVPGMSMRGRGRVAIMQANAEPNISAGNLFMWRLACMFMNSRAGKEWLVSRGYANLTAFHNGWNFTNFSAYLSSNALRVGGTAAGRRLAQGLWETVNFNSLGFNGNSHVSANAPTWADVNTSFRFGAGSAFTMSITGHTLDDISGSCLRFLMRSFGKNIGNPVGTAAGTDGDTYGGIYGLERTGSNGSLGTWNGSGEVPTPPTFPGGPRICHAGIPWFYGFAPGASGVTGATLQTTTVPWSSGNGGTGIPSSKTAAGITGYNADNKMGVPVYSKSETGTDNANWSISGGVFTNRRGCPVANTYPFPFLGQTGIISEGFTEDAGSIRAHNNRGMQSQRSSANYMRETLSVIAGLLMGEAIVSQGPDNLAKNPSMASGWSSSDANWSVEAANSGHKFRSSSVYRHKWVTGLTGNSGELLSTKTDAGVVVAGQKNMFSLQVRPVGGASAKVNVSVMWLNASDATISTVPVSTLTVASGTTRDVSAILLAPALATSMRWVITVDRPSATADVLVGGANLRWEPDPQIDWSEPVAADVAIRGRRGVLWFRAALLNGWKDLCKMAYGYGYRHATTKRGATGDLGTRSWANNASGSRYVSMFGFMINMMIPYWRTHVENYPPYGDGYTGYDWECTVTSASNSGIVTK